MVPGSELLVCATCGTQNNETDEALLKSCRICDDPRQFVPPTGQAWTTLAAMRKKYRNEWTQDAHDSRVLSIRTTPKFAIGQRAFLLKTNSGNVLWDMVALLDDETKQKIDAMGGLKAIVISHPHYYTTYLEWALAFNCPVYMSVEDKDWICRSDHSLPYPMLIKAPTQEILPGVTAIKAGGHFPGSLVLHWDQKLFIADTLVTVPSALYHIDRPVGTSSFAFLWSIPNTIPLSPPEILGIWRALEPFNFESTHGAFKTMDIYDKKIKGRILESMKIQVRHQGFQEHEILRAQWQG